MVTQWVVVLLCFIGAVTFLVAGFCRFGEGEEEGVLGWFSLVIGILLIVAMSAVVLEILGYFV